MFATRWHPSQYNSMAPYSAEVSPSAHRRNIYLEGPVFTNRRTKKPNKFQKSKYDTINPPREKEHVSASIISSMMQSPVHSVMSSRQGSFKRKQKYRAPPPPSFHNSRRTSLGSMGSSTDAPVTRLKKKRMAPQPPMPRIVSREAVYEPPIDYEMDTPPPVQTPERPITPVVEPTVVPPPPPPPPPIIITEPAPVMKVVPKKEMPKVEDDHHAMLQLEIVKAAEERSRRVVNVEELIPRKKKNAHDLLLQQLGAAIDERTKRRSKGTLKMTVKMGKNGKSMYYRAPDVKPVIKAPARSLSVVSDTDWTPEDDLGGDNLDDGVTEIKQITSQGKATPASLQIFDPSTVPGEGKTLKKSQNKSLKKKMKNSVKNAIGSIGKSLSRLKNIKNIINNDEWEIHYPENYDTPPSDEDMIKVHHIEKRPAYAYHPAKEQLVLLPDYDRIVVTEDGRKFREASLSSIQKPAENDKNTLVTPIILGDDDIKKTIKIQHERSDNETIDREFEWVRKVDSVDTPDGNPKPGRQQVPVSMPPPPPPPPQPEPESEPETVSMKTDSDRGNSPRIDDSGSVPGSVPVYTNSLPGYHHMHPYNGMMMNPMMYPPYIPYGNPYMMPPHLMNPAFMTPGISPYATLERPATIPAASSPRASQDIPTTTIIDTVTGASTIRAAPTEPAAPPQIEDPPRSAPEVAPPTPVVAPPAPVVAPPAPEVQPPPPPPPPPTALTAPTVERRPSLASKQELVNGPIGFRRMNFQPPASKTPEVQSQDPVTPPWDSNKLDEPAPTENTVDSDDTDSPDVNNNNDSSVDDQNQTPTSDTPADAPSETPADDSTNKDDPDTTTEDTEDTTT